MDHFSCWTLSLDLFKFLSTLATTYNQFSVFQKQSISSLSNYFRHILGIITPNWLKLVPIFYRLIKKQLSWRNLGLVQPLWSLKLACKTRYGIKTLSSLLKPWSLMLYQLIIICNHAITLLNQTLIDISMQEGHLGGII